MTNVRVSGTDPGWRCDGCSRIDYGTHTCRGYRSDGAPCPCNLESSCAQYQPLARPIVFSLPVEAGSSGTT